MGAGTLPGRGNSFQIKINAAAETTFMCPQHRNGSQEAGSKQHERGPALWWRSVKGNWEEKGEGGLGKGLPWPHSANQNAMKVNSLEN